jgi:transcriptional regulator
MSQYQPAHFVEADPVRLHALIRACPLGTLITRGADGEPVADRVPFWLDTPEGAPVRLRAHVARANPLWRVHPAERDVLVVFHGPDAYISPNWYPGKAEHGKAVPTWNYAMVQARGSLRVVDGDTDWLRALLEPLTDHHEADQPRPWRMADAPPDYLAAMLRAVVGLEISVTQLSGKFKLSQNQPPANREGVRAALAASAKPLAASTLHWMPPD